MQNDNADTRKPSDKAFGLSGGAEGSGKFGVSADQPRPSDQAFGIDPGHRPVSPQPVPEPPPGERAPLPPDTPVDPKQSGRAGEINGDQAGLGGPQVLPPEAGVVQAPPVVPEPGAEEAPGKS